MNVSRLRSLLFLLLVLCSASAFADIEDDLEGSGCTMLSESTSVELVNGQMLRKSQSTWRCGDTMVYVTDSQYTTDTPGGDWWTRDQYGDPERVHRTGSWEGYGTGPSGTAPWTRFWHPWGEDRRLIEDGGDSCLNCGW